MICLGIAIWVSKNHIYNKLISLLLPLYQWEEIRNLIMIKNWMLQ